jgi:SHS2 domain-containing protein
LEIYGGNLKELFENACFALFDNMVNLKWIGEADSMKISLAPESIEELFLNWLRELIYRFNIDYFVPKRAEILSLDESGLEAELFGERFDPCRHELRIEVKSPTYHMFSFEKLDDHYRARVLFDV